MTTISSYITRVSDAIPKDSLSRMWEGWAIRDVNGDAIPDLVLANGGDASTPVGPDDNPISILLGQEDYTFELADTSDLAPPGWINDFVFVDSNKNGIPEIIAIDHGVEIATSLLPDGRDPTAGDPEEYWEPLGVYEFDVSTKKFSDRTEKAIGNDPGFYHSAGNSADLDNDGIRDVVVASVEDGGSFNIFTGDRDNILVENSEPLLGDRFDALVTESSPDFVVAGAAGFLDYRGDGDYDAILLPYDFIPEYPRSEEGVILEFDNGGFVAD